MGELPSKCKVMYLARDKNGKLFSYGEEPVRVEKKGCFMGSGYVDRIDDKLFPKITWENSPVNIDNLIHIEWACEWLRHNASKYTVGNILAEDFKEAMIEKMG